MERLPSAIVVAGISALSVQAAEAGVVNVRSDLIDPALRAQALCALDQRGPALKIEAGFRNLAQALRVDEDPVVVDVEEVLLALDSRSTYDYRRRGYDSYGTTPYDRRDAEDAREVYPIDTWSCYSNCHSNCHGSRGWR